jgi:hypothetical protein
VGQTVKELPADMVFLLTGYRADSALMAAAGVSSALTTDRSAIRDVRNQRPRIVRGRQRHGGRGHGTVFIENGRFHGEKSSVISTRDPEKNHGAQLR